MNQDSLGMGGNMVGTYSNGSCTTPQGVVCEIWAKNLVNGSYAVALYNSVSTLAVVRVH